ncbi:MAG: hypothetical protein ACRDXX_12270 [Stackebrandtia sp.]
MSEMVTATQLGEKAFEAREMAVWKSFHEEDEIYRREGDPEWSARRDEYAWMIDDLVKFVDPNPENFTSMISSLENAERLITGTGDVDGDGENGRSADKAYGTLDSKDALSDWQGDAETAFTDEYVEPWDEIVSNQANLVKAVKGALEANASVYIAARKDAYGIAASTLDALTGIDPDAGQAEKDKAGLSLALAVAAAVTVTVVTAGTGATVGLTILGGAFGVAGSAAGNLPTLTSDASIPGNSVAEVLGSLGTAVSQLEDKIGDEERRIADSCRETAGTVGGPDARNGGFAPPRPDLASITEENVGDVTRPPEYYPEG